MDYLTPKEAADAAGISLGYLNYLRTPTAKERGHAGPAYYVVELDPCPDFANPRRIRYDEKDISIWVAAREIAKAAAPKITRVAG